ncbi:GTP-binding protein [Mycoplasmopsis californica]|uniref:GTPase Era n=1 Tax=Mycoplasmopsis equigenitalium TaxID=114883 RepID=A0ABY5J0Q8_9BACT|nr:GTPase Era [Mycoplasmopsis equigenitalium]UUD36839.1 GTPase Era [Mycoplasmopsis equigenitalium]VEU69865.1 GTP-binding protein [Mycoplasmopsis californica]
MKVCFVSIIGRPNVGKSTLLNNIIGFEAAITTPVAQTTRNQIQGIYNEDDYQIVFCDTPGIHKPLNKLGESLNKQAFSSLEDIDVVLFLTPINESISRGDEFIIDKIKKVKNKVAIISKTDIDTTPEEYTKKVKQLQELGFEEIWPYNSKNQDNSTKIIENLKKYTYESAPFYDTDQITNQPTRFIVAEAIRKFINENLYNELPHSVCVEITNFIEYEDKSSPWEIEAVIYCKRESQKGIIIGKNATMLKKIGYSARMYLQDLLNQKIKLFLNVKVNKNWPNNEAQLKKWGY